MKYDKDLHSKSKLGLFSVIPAIITIPMIPTAAQCKMTMAGPYLHIKMGDMYLAGIGTGAMIAQSHEDIGKLKSAMIALKDNREPSYSQTGSYYYPLTVEQVLHPLAGSDYILSLGDVPLVKVRVDPNAQIESSDEPADAVQFGTPSDSVPDDDAVDGEGETDPDSDD